MSVFNEASDDRMVLGYRQNPEVEEVVKKNRKTLLDALDCLAAGNVEAFWAIFDPDVVFYEASCLPYGGAHKGLEATRKAHARVHQVFSSIKTVFEAVLAAGDIAILYQTLTFCVRENGNTGQLPVAELFRFRNGKVVEWRALYFDACMVAQAIKGGG